MDSNFSHADFALINNVLKEDDPFQEKKNIMINKSLNYI